MIHDGSTFCTCDRCHAIWSARRRSVMAARAQNDARYTRRAEQHGITAYRRGRCRCPLCRQANADYQRIVRARARGEK